VNEQKPNVDYVKLVSVPAEVTPGSTITVRTLSLDDISPFSVISR
jgi:hypothetical protein